VTAVQFLVATLAALPVAAITEGTPAATGGAGTAVSATAGLALAGTLARSRSSPTGRPGSPPRSPVRS
jgi:hypothetical protein